MRAIELLSDQPQPSALLRQYKSLTGRPQTAWEGFYTAVWAETVKAVAEACSGDAVRVSPHFVKRWGLIGPSPFHFREYW